MNIDKVKLMQKQIEDRKESVIDSEWKLFNSGKYKKRSINTWLLYSY